VAIKHSRIFIIAVQSIWLSLRKVNDTESFVRHRSSGWERKLRTINFHHFLAKLQHRIPLVRTTSHVPALVHRFHRAFGS
jgi:hypothetical protein